MTDDRPAWSMTTARTEQLAAGATYAARRGPHWILVLEGAAVLEGGGDVHPLLAGDAVLVGARQAFALSACTDASFLVNDVAVGIPTHPMPSIVVVPGFAPATTGSPSWSGPARRSRSAGRR